MAKKSKELFLYKEKLTMKDYMLVNGSGLSRGVK
jgi:D-alanyl-D-alanine carboxypeptidase